MQKQETALQNAGLQDGFSITKKMTQQERLSICFQHGLFYFLI
jgi:hypothetical protein